MKRSFTLRAAAALALVFAGGAYAGELTMFSGPDFRGANMTLNGDVRNLDRSGFNDRAESLMIRSGRWEVCSDANFAGYCAVLGPGDYRMLDGPLFRRISSAREMAPIAYEAPSYYRYDYAYDNPPAIYVPPSYVPPVVDVPRGRYSALELFTLPGFRGSTMRFDRNATTLDTRATDEGVASLIVREGTWELCDGINNAGDCRVYEPGRYANLGSATGHAVGSLRRIG